MLAGSPSASVWLRLLALIDATVFFAERFVGPLLFTPRDSISVRIHSTGCEARWQ
jgi:hypothetical protein